MRAWQAVAMAAISRPCTSRSSTGPGSRPLPVVGTDDTAQPAHRRRGPQVVAHDVADRDPDGAVGSGSTSYRSPPAQQVFVGGVVHGDRLARHRHPDAPVATGTPVASVATGERVSLIRLPPRSVNPAASPHASTSTGGPTRSPVGSMAAPSA